MSDCRALVPADCDLRDFPRMMIDIPRLRASVFDATPDDAAWRAAFNLWMSSWHGDPAASLENDEAALCKAAGLGRDLRTWRKVRPVALRGWTLCEDGRLYHPTVAEFALEAWIEKLAQRLSSGAGNAKRWGTAFDPHPIKADIAKAAELLAMLNPRSAALPKASRYMSRASPDGIAMASRRDADTFPAGSQGKGREREEVSSEPDGSSEPVSDAIASSVGAVVADPVRQAFDEWNELASRLKLPRAKLLDRARRTAIQTRLRDGGLEAWRSALSAVERSPLCRGENERAWRADLDFVCQAKSWRRLLEGFYGDDGPMASNIVPLDPAQAEARRRAIAEWAENLDANHA